MFNFPIPIQLTCERSFLYVITITAQYAASRKPGEMPER